jgi:hypothetical protein
VAGAGWTLFGDYRAGWGIVSVNGLSGYDGMCRPTGFNEFVFVDGAFAGTISPVQMDSRSDGVASGSFIIGSESLTATFQRYRPTDSLCCPSGSKTVFYRIDRSGGRPLLVPQSF